MERPEGRLGARFGGGSYGRGPATGGAKETADAGRRIRLAVFQLQVEQTPPGERVAGRQLERPPARPGVPFQPLEDAVGRVEAVGRYRRQGRHRFLRSAPAPRQSSRTSTRCGTLARSRLKVMVVPILREAT